MSCLIIGKLLQLTVEANQAAQCTPLTSINLLIEQHYAHLSPSSWRPTNTATTRHGDRVVHCTYSLLTEGIALLATVTFEVAR
jgi:hypothetical protein